MSISNSRRKFIKHYELWEKSGLNRHAYCKRNGLNYSWFLSHQKSLSTPNVNPGFEQISLTARNTSGIEFHYPDGRYFVFKQDTPVELISAIVRT
jgi:hypothetical protein